MRKLWKMFLGICFGVILIGILYVAGLIVGIGFLGYKAYKEYKINKFSSKFKAECAGIAVLAVLLIATFNSDTDTTTQVTQDDTTTQTQIEQPVEEYEDQEEYTEEYEDQEEEYKMSLDEQLAIAEFTLDTILSQSFEEYGYELQIEGNRIGVLLNMPMGVLQEGLQNPDEWNTEIVENVIILNNNIVDGLTESGCTDLEIAVIVGSFVSDTTFLAVKDGIVYYDYVNGIDNLY